ncbi:hypothetical protein, partial [Caballeronia sp. GAWG1-5s-s]|uniref:hypothetical protein n=1 Tax=Caballeronia sp. GAWG1-5s-s TaxID=2921743 RepID=UPI002028A3A3
HQLTPRPPFLSIFPQAAFCTLLGTLPRRAGEQFFGGLGACEAGNSPIYLFWIPTRFSLLCHGIRRIVK